MPPHPIKEIEREREREKKKKEKGKGKFKRGKPFHINTELKPID